MMNTELEGELDLLRGGLDDRRGKLERDLDGTNLDRVGVRVREGATNRDLVGVGVLVLVGIIGVRVGEGLGVLVRDAGGGGGGGGGG
jgi:hypothetical protein